MSDTTTQPLIGCVQHDCDKCKSQQAEIAAQYRAIESIRDNRNEVRDNAGDKPPQVGLD